MTTARAVPTRHVGCSIELTVHGPAWLALQVAVAEHPGVSEKISITLDGSELPIRELANRHGGRMHAVDSGPGTLAVTYRASVDGTAAPASGDETDAFEYLRPSRYAPNDLLSHTAMAEFAGIDNAAARLEAVSSWVGRRISYQPCSSTPTDSAVDTLLTGAGVCRDFAHLVVGFMRALDVPARMVACYAPGLSPMDFHAVAEVLIEGLWRAVDPTMLAPRQSLVRISTGRDAADTAFLSSYGAQVDLLNSAVFAYVDSDLPRDQPTELVSIG
jgi:transglutaminase-like putative cysteine protease